MGVSGAGKSEIASRLAKKLGMPFIEADNFHSDANKAKMFAGIPLTDGDRWPWLALVGAEIAAHEVAVATCSALKRVYRDRLRDAAPGIFFVELDGSRELLASRLAGRRGHFMAAGLIDSQLATLEPLQLDERGLRIDISPGIGKLVSTILDNLDRVGGP